MGCFHCHCMDEVRLRNPVELNLRMLERYRDPPMQAHLLPIPLVVLYHTMSLGFDS